MRASSNHRSHTWLSRQRWLSVAGACLLVLSASAVQAAAPAGSKIGNQASASYLDPNGVGQLSTSNLVETVVQQVGAYTLASNNTKSAAAGNTVYMPHVLSNTGNGADAFTLTAAQPATGPQFSRIEIYASTTGNGLPDSTTPLCSSSAGGAIPACTSGFVQSVSAGSTFGFVVAYTVPAGATAVSWPSQTGTVTAVPNTTSTWFSTYSPNTLSNLDTVNLTTAASFQVTKALAAPQVAAPGGGAWPTVTSSGPASSSTCSTTWSAGLNSSANCTYTVYTLSYKNIGASSGTLSITDSLPSGLQYVAGSAVWSSAGGTALSDSGTGNPSGITYSFASASSQISATLPSVGPNVSGTVSFVVLVKPTATPGQSTTTNTATYGTTSCLSAPGTPCTDGLTNSSPFVVSATYSVVTANVASAVHDAVDGNPAKSGIDLVGPQSVIAGGAVNFSAVVSNNGNAVDTFNINVAALGAQNNFPAGTVFTLLKADGVTPLIDTNGDGIADTGPLAPGANVSVVVRVAVPASVAVGTLTTPYDALVTARSVNDPVSTNVLSRDSAWLRVNTVVGSLIDLTNSAAGTGVGAVAGGDLGPGPSPLPTLTNTTPAGTGTLIPLFVRNNDSVGNTYSFAASSTGVFPGTLPAGWTVKYVAAGGDCSSAAVTTLTVASGAQGNIAACVTPPANAILGTQGIFFRVTSTANASTGGLVSDVIHDAVTVVAPAVAQMSLSPNNSGQVAPGGSVVYAHTLSNVGNQACGAFTATATLPATDLSAGWTTAIYIDVNGDGQIDAGDTLVTGPIPALTAGSATKLLLKVFAPGGASAGQVDVANLTLTDTSAVCPPVSVTDTTTVVTGQLRLVKQQALDATCDGTAVPSSAGQIAASPGQCVIYRVTATNEGTIAVSNVRLNDAIPTFTSYAGAVQPAVQCTSTSLSGTAAAFATVGAPVSAVSCGSAANSLAPGGSVTMTFAVRLAP